jgi:hypothetical protein
MLDYRTNIGRPLAPTDLTFGVFAKYVNFTGIRGHGLAGGLYTDP